MAAYLKVILRLAAKAGPVVLIVAKELAPQINRMLKENPDAFSGITGRFQKVLGSKKEGSTPKGLENRSIVLREQVTYLYASANNAEAARRAISWRNELDALERSLPVIKVMKRSQQISERRRISKRLDELSSQILAASLTDEVEDAVVVHDTTNDETFPHPGTPHVPNTDGMPPEADKEP